MCSLLLLLLPSPIHAFIGQSTIPHGPTRSSSLHAETVSSLIPATDPTTTNRPEYRHYNATLAPLTPQLHHYQSLHAPIASSFQPSTFQPLPPLDNCHIQTIGGVFLRNNCAYYSNPYSLARGVIDSLLNIGNNEYVSPIQEEEWYYDERERVLTPSSGAFFTVDHKYVNSDSPSRGRVVIVHGLESNSNSSLCIDMSSAFIERGYDVSVINFRGCCGTDVQSLYDDGTLVKNGENTLMYHLGFVEDLIYYLSILAEKNGKPVYLSGFSLGANVVLKALGQMGADAIDLYGVAGAAVAGAPFDTERNYLQFHQDPISRAIYVESLLNKLKSRAQEILDVHYDGDADSAGFDYARSMSATTIYELESACVAPLFGFEDHIDYYRKTSCGNYLERIGIPTLVVNARDDPFFDSGFIPWDKVCNGSGEGGAPVKIVMTEGGGHLGYIFHQVDGESEVKERKASWISEELARFVDHAHFEISTGTGTGSVKSGLPLV